MTVDANSSWLAVDVGNSRIKIGVFDSFGDPGTESAEIETQQSISATTQLPGCVDFHSVPLKLSVCWEAVLKDRGQAKSFQAVIVGSNQHGVDRVVENWPGWLREPIVIRNSQSFPIDIQVDEPGKVGLDRLLNAVAVDAVRTSGHEAIIVDCGTATTVDLISATGAFCGGAILPGFTLCARALNRYTEVLPLISMNELFDLPPSEDCHPALGANTQSAIMSGVFWGQIGAVRELVSRLSQKQSPNGADQRQTQLLLTGGGARLLVPYFADAIYCPYLPLQGLVLAAASQQS